MPTFLLAQAAPDLPSITRWEVWGPLGVLFALGVGYVIDRYWSIERPRLKQKSRNEHEAHVAHIDFVNGTKEAVNSLAASQKLIADTVGPRVERLESKLDLTHGLVSDLHKRPPCPATRFPLDPNRSGS